MAQLLFQSFNSRFSELIRLINSYFTRLIQDLVPIHGYNKVFRHVKQKLVFCSKQTMRLAKTDHVICFNQSHGLFRTRLCYVAEPY